MARDKEISKYSGLQRKAASNLDAAKPKNELQQPVTPANSKPVVVKKK
jgi:hypothetical protein